jgi:anti-sigma regulatory factor (Ser/Thr protein kinase)
MGSASQNPASSIEWRFRSDDAIDAVGMRDTVRTFLCTEGDSSSDIDGAIAIFGELTANVVQHAPGEVSVTIEWCADEPCLSVADRGPGFIKHFPIYDLWREGGRGLEIIDSLAGSSHAANSEGTGRIDVSARAGKGTMIRVMLPVHRRARRL